MTANTLLDALGVALTPPNTQAGDPISYNSATGRLSTSWGPAYNLSQAQITAIVTAFNALSASLLADQPAPPPPPTKTGVRSYLIAPATYYVSANGSDVTGNGTQSAPWATPSFAYNWCRDNLDLGGQKVTVQLLTSLIGSSICIGPLTGQVNADDFTFLGDSGNPNAFSVTDSTPGAWVFGAQEGARFGVCGMTISAPGAGGFGLCIEEGVIAPRNVWFGSCGDSSLNACGPRSFIYGKGILTWLHGATFTSAADAEDHALIALPCTLQISGAPVFSGAFVQADLGGMIDATAATVIPASAQGRRFAAYSFGIVFTGPSNNPNFFPGSQPGVVNGGFYQ